ncbi:aminotransferase class I/II [Xylanimonas oleitrophica]|uniref:cysteine-S-conjugate beta-lyase n=1 Tax=Xylanimonas oleitrophica TaxID=2607479 RepID=A0A2W5X286_9MICO|nr:aminotransferase class I/II-fold pyridoxal phosphate-dependent enzyme [Xylanimonas oleitrophica]PZR54926.1 aminotransferase class I/II [Xylanimonas oleitrophica]
MPRDTELDAITVDSLRAAGSVKWTAFPDTLGAFVAEMDFGTAPPVARALHDAVDRGLLGYLPGHLEVGMQRAYAAFALRRFGWEVDPQRVRPVPDVLVAFEAVLTHFTRPGSPVILPTPAYMPFLPLPADLGREVLQVPLVPDEAHGGRYAYDLDALDAAFASGAQLLVLVNPHNPTGRVLERAEMLAISEVVERHGGRVFADEIHAPLVHPGHQHVPYASVSAATAAHTITATSASKAWNVPGLKAAQLVLSDEADARRWSRVGRWVEHMVATPGVVAHTVAYDDGEPWLQDVLRYLDGNRRLLGTLVDELLPGVRYTPPEGTYLAWLDVRGAGLDQPARFFREAAGVALTDGADCGRAGEGFVRLTLATPRPVLTEIVERMADALAAR